MTPLQTFMSHLYFDLYVRLNYDKLPASKKFPLSKIAAAAVDQILFTLSTTKKRELNEFVSNNIKN